MRINIPAFRLPEQVLDEEIGYIVDMGVEVRYNTPVDSLKALLDTNEFDAVFVGSGAPKGKELDVPGRHDTDQIFIGIDWLESIHFGHVDSVGKRVLIIGVGNTAMDCCRSAKRLGATDVKVIARKTRKYFKASPWELEDAEEEGVEILENLQPVRFIIENGVLTGMEFDKFKSIETASGLKQEVDRPRDPPVRLGGAGGRPGQRLPLDRADIGLEFGKWDMPVVDKTTFMSTRPGVFFGGDAAFGPANIIWAVEQGHQAAISDPQLLPGHSRDRAAGAGDDAHQHQDGAARVGLQQRLRPAPAAEDAARRSAGALREHDDRGREGLHRGADARRSGALPQLRHGDALRRLALHRVRRVHRHLSGRLPHDHARRPRSRNCGCGSPAPALNTEQPVFVSGPLKQTSRVMAKDENVCLHCGLCAERCPTYAWDMRKFVLQIPYAGQPAGSIPLARCQPVPGRSLQLQPRSSRRRDIDTGNWQLATDTHAVSA